MKSANKVLEQLYDREAGYFALTDLVAATGLPAARVNGALEELSARGHAIEWTPAHGVRLARPAAMDAHLVERALRTERVGRNVICFAEVDSTNDVAFDSAAQTGADGLVVLADAQRRGRGRLGRAWLSPPGSNVLMSVLLLEADGRLSHEALTVAAGLAVAEGIADATGLDARLKWPNDVLLDDAKVAGVLVEVRRRDAGRTLVIGVGLNANAEPPAEQTDRPAVCLARRLGHPVERVELVRAVLRRLDGWVGRIAVGGTTDLQARWLARCDMLNERLCVRCRGHLFAGRVLDVSPLDGLFLACDDGQRVHLPAEFSSVEYYP